MLTAVNWNLLIGGIIFYFLAFLMFKDYRRNQHKNDFWLGWYFISLGSTNPILGLIPLTPENLDLFFPFHFISSASLPFIIIFINLYLDKSTRNAISPFTYFVTFISSFLLAIFLFVLKITIVWKISIFGPFPMSQFSTITGIIVIILILILLTLSFIRFLIQGLQTIRFYQNAENYRLMKLFIYLMSIGPLLYVCFNILKRNFPILLSLDYTFFYLFYIGLIILYRRHRNLFYFLPGTLERAIIYYQDGTPLYVYDFKTRKIEERIELDENGSEYKDLQSLFNATFKINPINTSQSKSVQITTFENSEILIYITDTFRWILIMRAKQTIYSEYLTQIAEQIESKSKNEVR